MSKNQPSTTKTCMDVNIVESCFFWTPGAPLACLFPEGPWGCLRCHRNRNRPVPRFSWTSMGPFVHQICSTQLMVVVPCSASKTRSAQQRFWGAPMQHLMMPSQLGNSSSPPSYSVSPVMHMGASELDPRVPWAHEIVFPSRPRRQVTPRRWDVAARPTARISKTSWD